MLTVGDKFPAFNLKAVVSTDLKKGFTTINEKSFEGKWLVVFAWPKDFTFVCPTEIAEFARLNGEFADRDAVVLGGSTDNEHSKLGWRREHPDLHNLPIWNFADNGGKFARDLGVLNEGEGVAFRATFPSAGRYRLFLEVKHAGTVRTAVFTVSVDQPAAGGTGHGH